MADKLEGSVLVASPDAEAAQALESQLREAGLLVTVATSAADAVAALETEMFRVALASVVLRVGKKAEPLISQLSHRWPEVPVVGLLEEQSADNVLRAMRSGACDAIVKRPSPEALVAAVERALATAGGPEDEPPQAHVPASDMLGASPLMESVRDQVQRAAAGTATVLVRGESGTGKELVARAIHDLGDRADSPFVKVNCAGLPETLLDSELFGHERGAFTGAIQSKPGRVEVAGKGTLFLDEIGDITPLMQVKLLRLLQDREYERLGSNQTRKTDVRFVVATHRDLEKMIADGTFREDLFYRLNVVPIWVPPLRARRGDVELLARHFFDAFSRANGRDDLTIGDDAIAALTKQRWPGNVRELQNIIERLVVMGKGSAITAEAVLGEIQERTNFSTQMMASLAPVPGRSLAGAPPSLVIPLDDEMRAAEKKAIQRALNRAEGSRAKAARLLGIGRTTLYRKMAEHGLD